MLPPITIEFTPMKPDPNHPELLPAEGEGSLTVRGPFERMSKITTILRIAGFDYEGGTRSWHLHVHPTLLRRPKFKKGIERVRAVVEKANAMTPEQLAAVMSIAASTYDYDRRVA